MGSAAPAAGAVYVANGGLLDPLLVSADGPAKKAGHGAKGKHWAAADKAERRAAKESGGEDGRALLFRSYKVMGSLLHPYRYASSARFAIFLVHAYNYCRYSFKKILSVTVCNYCPKNIVLPFRLYTCILVDTFFEVLVGLTCIHVDTLFEVLVGLLLELIL
jgi:hypothetical protein